MLIRLILEGLTIGAMLVAIRGYSLAVPKAHRTQRVTRTALAAAIVLACSVLALDLANAIQHGTGINLHIAADSDAKAVVWLKEHTAFAPSPREVGNNLRVIRDGQTFYAANRSSFNADLRGRMEEISRLSVRPNHLLSSSEQEQYYRAAQEVWNAIQTLAGPQHAGAAK